MKRNFTKILSLLLMLTVLCSVVFAISITSYAASDYLKVKGVYMNDGEYLRENDNATTTTRPGSGSDYAYYKDGVLYLYNFDINFNDSAMFSAIFVPGSKLTIDLNGSNTITATQPNAIRTYNDTVLTFRGSGSLTLNSSTDYGIICGERMEVTGGTLNINAVGKAIDVDNYIQTGGTVNVTSSKDYEALYIPENATISGGTLTVKASNASWAANIGGNMTVNGGTVNIQPQTDMVGLGVGGTYTQTGGNVNLMTKGFAGLVVGGTGKVSLTGGELKATGNGVGLQTSKANIEIGRCDVTMEGISTGIDCAGTVTLNGKGITRITATTNGISCKDFQITKTEEFLVSGQSGLAVKSSSKAWTVANSYATSVSTNYQGKDAVPLSNQSAATAKYFFTREAVIYIAGIPMSYDEYLPKNGKAASTYKLSDNYIHIQANGDHLELNIKNCNILSSGSTEAIKAATSIAIIGTGKTTISTETASAILLTNGNLYMEHSGTVYVESGSLNGIFLQNGSYKQLDGTVDVEGVSGILALQGDVTLNKGALKIAAGGFGITTKNLQVNGGSMDVIGSNRALLLTGSLSVKSGLAIKASTSTSSNPNDLGAYNSANIASYKRVNVDNHTCTGGTATCQTLAKCTICGQSYGTYGAHVLSTEWDFANAAGHAHRCTVAGCTGYGSVEKHTPGPAATETSEQRCTKCNYIITPKLNHTHKTTKVSAVAPTCTKNGHVEYYICSGCSKIFQDAAATREFASRQDTISPALGHRFTENWNMNATEHWHACSACGVKESVEKHVPGAAATETTDQTCTVCAYVIKKAVGHSHSFGDHWFNDEAAHWKACACGEISAKADHADANGDFVCDSCNWVLSTGETDDPTEETDPVEGTDPTDATDPTEATDPTVDPGEKDPVDQQPGEDDGSSAWIIVVIVIAVLLVAAGTVLVIILVKRKKN